MKKILKSLLAKTKNQPAENDNTVINTSNLKSMSNCDFDKVDEAMASVRPLVAKQTDLVENDETEMEVSNFTSIKLFEFFPKAFPGIPEDELKTLVRKARKYSKKSESVSIDPVNELHRMTSVGDWVYGYLWERGGELAHQYFCWLFRNQGLVHARFSKNKVVDVKQLFEVTFSDGTSKFVNGYRNYESYCSDFDGTGQSYIDTYEDKGIVRVKKNDKKHNYKICNL